MKQFPSSLVSDQAVDRQRTNEATVKLAKKILVEIEAAKLPSITDGFDVGFMVITGPILRGAKNAAEFALWASQVQELFAAHVRGCMQGLAARDAGLS